MEITAQYYYTAHVADATTKSTCFSHLGHLNIIYLALYGVVDNLRQFSTGNTPLFAGVLAILLLSV